MLKTKKQTPGEYASCLKDVLAGNLYSVILFGSGSGAEYIEGKSDYNLLVIVDRWSMLNLNQVTKVTGEWVKEGNPPPLLYTLDRLQASAEYFPIEMLDMKQNYKVVLGEDLLKSIDVKSSYLRLITGREMKVLRIQLRQGYIFAQRNDKKIAELMAKTIATCLILFKAALRLYTDNIPARKLDVLPSIAAKVKGVDVEALLTIEKLNSVEIDSSDINSQQLFERYMNSILAVGDAVDAGLK